MGRLELLGIVVLTAACAAPATPSDLPATGAPTPRAPTPAACMGALIEGELVAHSGSGLGLRLTDGRLLWVVWAPGYSAVDGVLRDAAGSVVASQGNLVQVGGGEANGPWIACHQPGSVKVLAKASPHATQRGEP